MVRKISAEEYLKRYGNMTEHERLEYDGRVGEWLSSGGRLLSACSDAQNARMQNVFQVSISWNDEECRAFEEGARLLSALTGTSDTWLPDMLYAKSAKRAIRRMYSLLWEAEAHSEFAGTSKEERAEGTENVTHAVDGKPAWSPAVAPVMKADWEKIRHEAPPALFEAQATGMPEQGAVPARPRHIDQYVHLLPKKTQEKAALVQGLYRELDEAREKMRLLTEDPTASAADREAWAKKATKCDNTLRRIFDELDTEWAKLVEEGRVVVDDLGNARVVAGTGNTEDKNGAPEELTQEQRARRRELRKWLVDTRRGNGDTREEHVRKWQEAFREFLSIDGDAAYEDAKVMAAAVHYGIDVARLRQDKEKETTE